MESKGQINRYIPYRQSRGPSVFTINLTNGVTPFMAHFDGREYNSNFYRLGAVSQITVSQGWYRPKREEFDKAERSVQEHVLRGGLLHEELTEAIARQLPRDMVDAIGDFEATQELFRVYYGRRLPSQQA